MSNLNTEATVIKTFSTILGVEIKPAHNIDRVNTPQWNSLKHMEIMFGIEEQFSIEFSEAELSDLDSISKIIAILDNKYAT